MSSIKEKKVKLFDPKEVNYTKYEPYMFQAVHANEYFSYRYDNIYFSEYFLHCKQNEIPDPAKFKISFSHISNEEDQTSQDNYNFIDTYIKCLKDDSIRYISIMVKIYFFNSDEGHANSLIYDKLNDSFELFEPHGEISVGIETFNADDLYEEIENYLRSSLPSSKLSSATFTFYKPLDFCPNKSYQKSMQMKKTTKPKYFLEDHFCVVWSLWYIDLRLANNKLDRKSLVSLSIKSFQENSKSFQDFIGNYSSFVYYLNISLNECKINNTCTDNIILSIILQFFNLLNFDMLIFNDNSIDTKPILLKIIGNCGKVHLHNMCVAVNIHNTVTNFDNYSLRKALKRIVKGYNSSECSELYKQFIDYVYDYTTNSFSIRGNTYDKNDKIICPYDTEIINKILNNMIVTGLSNSRDVICASAYFILDKASIYAKDKVKHYGYLLLLLSPQQYNDYIKTVTQSVTYFESIRTLINNHKNDALFIETQTKIVTQIILLSNYILYLDHIIKYNLLSENP